MSFSRRVIASRVHVDEVIVIVMVIGGGADSIS